MWYVLSINKVYSMNAKYSKVNESRKASLKLKFNPKIECIESIKWNSNLIKI